MIKKVFRLHWILLASLISFLIFLALDKDAQPVLKGRAAAWAPRGDRIAFEAVNGFFSKSKPDEYSLYLTDAEGHPPQRIAENYGRIFQWSADGEKVAYRAGVLGGYKIFEIETGRTFNLPDAKYIAWLPNSDKILVFNRAGSLSVSQYSGSESHHLIDESGGPSRLFVSTDGSYVSYFTSSNGNSSVRLLHIPTSNLKTLHVSGGKQFGYWPQQEWSRHNGILLFVTYENDLFTYNPSSGKKYFIQSGVKQARWSPVLDQIAYLVSDSNLFLASSDGSSRESIRPMLDGQISWLKDGSGLIVGNYVKGEKAENMPGAYKDYVRRGVMVIDLRPNGHDVPISGSKTDESHPPAVSPDGRRLLLNYSEGFEVLDFLQDEK